MKSVQLAIGPSDFKAFRQSKAYYVDKTTLIQKVIDSPSQVLLLPRPRRFGKTLNLSTLRYFFEKSHEDLSSLFEKLAISHAGITYQSYFARFPVIFLTFKDIKASRWEDCLAGIKKEIQREYARHRYILDDNKCLSEEESLDFKQILAGKGTTVDYWDSLKSLSLYLHRFHQEQIVILIDEYDTPIHASHAAGYYKNAVEFLRNFFSGGLKDNAHLYRGVVTGVLRIARESIFSGLNNLTVYSILSSKFASEFGFTKEEIERISTDMNLSAQRVQNISRWYNGYNFGGTLIYNPWSIVNYLAHWQDGFKPYWISTASDDLIRDLILDGTSDINEAIESLLRGEFVDCLVDENIVLRDVDVQQDAILSMLLFSGYLKAQGHNHLDGENLFYKLSIPNQEVRWVFTKVIRKWLTHQLRSRAKVDSLTQSLLQGDLSTFRTILQEFVINALSFHDTGGKETEKVYQAFILGLLVHLEPNYLVRSNRESGLGRYDIMIAPRKPSNPGVILELKLLKNEKPETVKKSLADALLQIEEKGYELELISAGANPIHKIGVVFDGKKIWLDGATVTAAVSSS